MASRQRRVRRGRGGVAAASRRRGGVAAASKRRRGGVKTASRRPDESVAFAVSREGATPGLRRPRAPRAPSQADWFDAASYPDVSRGRRAERRSPSWLIFAALDGWRRLLYEATNASASHRRRYALFVRRYDEDRVFLAELKTAGARLRRLPPGAPDYVHVKHAEAAARGPLTDLHAAGLGGLASPAGAAGAVAVGVVAVKALRGFVDGVG